MEHSFDDPSPRYILNATIAQVAANASQNPLQQNERQLLGAGAAQNPSTGRFRVLTTQQNLGGAMHMPGTVQRQTSQNAG